MKMVDTGYMKNTEVNLKIISKFIYTKYLLLEWYWIKSSNIIEGITDIATVLSQLNTIKIDVNFN